MLTADEDYSASFNDDGTVSIALVNGGKGDGATALTISGSILDPTKITAADIVGGVNTATGAETGLEVVRQVFPKLGMVPGILLAPRFSKDPMAVSYTHLYPTLKASPNTGFRLKCCMMASMMFPVSSYPCRSVFGS